MKRFIIKCVSAVLQFLSRIAVRLGVSMPKVIIYMDGGICSQMSMYLRGQFFREVAEVLYDTTWFELCGKDLDGRFDRKLELKELFPTLEFKTVSRKQKRFQCCYSAETMRVPDVHLPENLTLGSQCTKVAVHVRRGDLANREDQWYKKVPDSYFFNAVGYVKEHFPNVRLFLFSDEPGWVEVNLCPHFTAIPYHIFSGNKAYEDLYLISLCDVVIASQGSFGVWGARLNGDSVLIRPSAESESGFSTVQPFF